MSDDGFFREVEEELRSERLKNFWERFGVLIVAGAVLIVAVAAGYRGWEWYSARQASASGDRFLEALNLANDGQSDAAMAEPSHATRFAARFACLARRRQFGAAGGRGSRPSEANRGIGCEKRRGRAVWAADANRVRGLQKRQLLPVWRGLDEQVGAQRRAASREPQPFAGDFHELKG